MSITLPDGRTLDLLDRGDGDVAIVFHHGTPGAYWRYEPMVAAAVDAGFRWIATSRAGYGGSTRRPGRSVADNCDYVAAVLDQLGVERFVAVGWSGGGPHALACGALLAPRCAGVITLAGVAPFDGADAAGFDWFDGMGPENHAEFGAAVEGEAAVRAYLEPEREGLVAITGPDVAASLGGLIDEADRRVLTGEFAEALAESFRDGLRVGADGWIDDDLAFARPWGFDLAAVRVPVGVWQGDQDRMVPYSHGSYQVERLPDVRAHLLPGEGHLSIPLGRFDQVLAEARSFV
ncbi:MAG TPA: alpha/beta hydrolase [Jatrophihabitans sp.]|jgi:pimeloyl-ACP methyl ester carboxylesterase|uniref:alpha/beta fold hydrolase n=1 Tax=Jatrophihabitans sp. TaxID=1932789 RepID=UPI002E059378|nr:alpha/beta hydrolase [Jatrophihabitans sp.]